MNARTTTTLLACLLLPWIPAAFGQKAQRAGTLVSRSNVLESGAFDGAEVQREPVFTEVIHAEGTPWIRVHFCDYDLGRNSFVILTSLRDGDRQRLDSASLPIWSDTSGVFNGGQVELALYVASGDTVVFVNITSRTYCSKSALLDFSRGRITLAMATHRPKAFALASPSAAAGATPERIFS